jgi:hypothetical protein
VLSSISRLSTEVSDSSGLIPAYDQRIYAQVWSIVSPACLLY